MPPALSEALLAFLVRQPLYELRLGRIIDIPLLRAAPSLWLLRVRFPAEVKRGSRIASPTARDRIFHSGCDDISTARPPTLPNLDIRAAPSVRSRRRQQYSHSGLPSGQNSRAHSLLLQRRRTVHALPASSPTRPALSGVPRGDLLDMPGLCSGSHHLHPPPGQRPLARGNHLTFARGNCDLPSAKRERMTALARPARPLICWRVYFDTDDAQSLLSEFTEDMKSGLHKTHTRGRLAVEEYRKNDLAEQRLRQATTTYING
ncbi:hypothetical protein DFH08DRAFT_889273 [Mycena albidolilacea]|uniref:Uncharacterized protein n=1 Tax=Mycena albidolilacea TaxID=1033008 RepID=A0AAD6ZHK7_9AGAR|nr:hypothetical protein DFH08DRAFT_889273 [Mycena albidolilacea]